MVNEDLHYILTDKTSGEANANIDGVDQTYIMSVGYIAQMSLVMWYATTSG